MPETMRDVAWVRPAPGRDRALEERLRRAELELAEQQRRTLELAERLLAFELAMRMREARLRERESRLLEQQERLFLREAARPPLVMLWAAGVAISITTSVLLKRSAR